MFRLRARFTTAEVKSACWLCHTILVRFIVLIQTLFASFSSEACRCRSGSLPLYLSVPAGEGHQKGVWVVSGRTGCPNPRLDLAVIRYRGLITSARALAAQPPRGLFRVAPGRMRARASRHSDYVRDTKCSVFGSQSLSIDPLLLQGETSRRFEASPST